MPRSEQELLSRIVNDPRWFLENCVEVSGDSGGVVPFHFNAIQAAYYARVWQRHVLRDVHLKPRKYGFTTLRVGLGLHAALFHRGRIFRAFLHDKDAAEQVKQAINQMYESARSWFVQVGLDPDAFIPRSYYDNRKEYSFPQMQSAVFVDTCQSPGVGQSDVSHDIYVGEYALWGDQAKQKLAQVVASIPPKYPGRVTVDFNARGIGNDAYDLYQRAKLSGEDWNGYEPVFFSVADFPEVYPPDFLAKERREREGIANYPVNDEECWLQQNLSVFDWDQLNRAVTKDYAPRAERYLHGVDTATGQPGGDFQVIKSFAVLDGVVWEACEPYRVRQPEDLFAVEVDRRAREMPGVVVVERNMGGAVLTILKQLGTPGLYRHRDPVNPGVTKLGFQTTRASKSTMINTLSEMLREGSVKLVHPNGIREMREYEWKDSESDVAGAPDKSGAHDDEAMATMLAIQGLRARPKARAGYRD